ncbi:hypothetical protein PICSAR14_04142 [Mycobacterium avium subsp. paratuberculosis]|nr:hypothetical protein PICSAR14_04142 [Mycobacterium avium subsp. paratuberculosis]
MQPALGARHRGRVPHRGLEQHVGGIGAHLGAGRAHHAADRRGRRVVDDQDVDGFELALDVVEGDDGLAGPGEAHAEPAADPVAVVGVHGVAELEHHVVGHIDRRRGGADARQQQPALQPPRRHRGRVDAGDRAQREPPHPGVGLHRQRPGLAVDRQRLDIRGVDEFQVVGAGDLARQAAQRHAVAAVGGDRQVEDHVVESQHRGAVGARFGGARRQHQDPGMVGAQAEFGRRADHSVRIAAVGLARGDGEPARQRGAGQRHHHQVPCYEIRCAADDFTVNVVADVDMAEPDRLLEAGQLFDVGDPADGQRAVHRPQLDDLFDLVADADQGLFQFGGGDVPVRRPGGHDLAQPAVRNAHQAPTPNGSKNRTSPSTMSRMSGIPLRNCRVRSRPIPNANPE